MNSTENCPSETSETKLAAGVLHQAKKDLRRFHRGTSRVERELYIDAYQWVMSDDFSWPYSFLNVCGLLNIVPEQLRHELIDEHSLGFIPYWTRRCGRLVSQLRLSASQLSTEEQNGAVGYDCERAKPCLSQLHSSPGAWA